MAPGEPGQTATTTQSTSTAEMSSTYTPANTFHSTVTIPSDGDLADAGSVNVSLEALADNYNYLNLFLTGTNTGANLVSPTLTNPTLVGTLAITVGALVGDGTFLNISQPGETARFLGNTVFSGGNTHRVDGLMNFAASSFTHVQSGANFFFDGGSAVNMSGTMSAFGHIILTATGHITFRNGIITATPSSQSVSISDGDEFFADPTTSNLIITVLNAGANNGDRIRFTVVNATNTTNFVNIQREDLTSLIPFGSAIAGALRNDTGYWVWVDIIRRGGRWECSATGKF